MFSLLIVICMALASEVIARPGSDSFVFRDDEDGGDNQILPSIDDLKSIGASDEVVKQELENGKLFQGDIKLVQDQKDYYLAKPGSVPPRTGWIDEHYRWPKDKQGYVILPFYLSPESKFSKNENNKFYDSTTFSELVLFCRLLSKDSATFCNERHRVIHVRTLQAAHRRKRLRTYLRR